MKASELIAFLQQRLREPLPGALAQVKMAPQPVDMERFRTIDPASYREGAVMLLMLKDNDQLKFPLIQRPRYQGVHSGQVSLPGGKRDRSDQDAVYTAIRETKEEIGLHVERNEIIGSLSEMFIPPSKFRVKPIVAFSENRQDMVPDEREVVEAFTVPLEHLLDASRLKFKKLNIRGQELETPYFDLYNKVVWGATAMILSEFVEILKEKY